MDATNQLGKVTPKDLLRRMDQWTNLANEGKLALLQKLECARKSPADASEAALADMVCTVAAALAPPRRSATPSEEIDVEDGTGLFTCLGCPLVVCYELKLLGFHSLCRRG